jgi:membrane associated rhomboid family serine protease
VAEGQYWRLITCTFLHGGLIHILFNTVMFVRFSAVVDNWLGPWVAMGMYALIALSSSAAELLVGGGPFLVGASGVVYGLFGFLWVLARRRDDAADAANRHIVETMISWLFICAVVNYFGGAIANTAHVYGLLLGWMLGRAFVARRKLRLPWALGTLAAWALPLVLLQPAVWNVTLGRLPLFNQWYPYSVPAEVRQWVEDPENAPDITLFPRKRSLSRD